MLHTCGETFGWDFATAVSSNSQIKTYTAMNKDELQYLNDIAISFFDKVFSCNFSDRMQNWLMILLHKHEKLH